MKASLALIPVVLAAGSGCYLLEDRYHCSYVQREQLHGCMEFYDFDASPGGAMMKGSFGPFCQAAGFGEVGPGTCPEEKRIGGCREEAELYSVIKWQYEHPDQKDTLADMFCVSKETLLGPDGEPVRKEAPKEEGTPDPICSTNAGDAVIFELVNAGSRPVTLYWGDLLCAEHVIDSALAGGETRTIHSTVGHVFRVRAGSNVADGKILLEFTIAEDAERHEAPGW